MVGWYTYVVCFADFQAGVTEIELQNGVVHWHVPPPG